MIVTEFYSGLRTDHAGRSLSQLQDQSLNSLEMVHDYIQWLFPLPERSQYNPESPLLTKADIKAFRETKQLRDRLLVSLEKLLDLYGLELVRNTVVFDVDFKDRAKEWLTPYNHNFLRISRILRSLTLLGCQAEATSFLELLEELFKRYKKVIGEETLTYWRNAVKQ